MPAPLDTAALRARLHAVLAARGVVRSRELQAALGVSQATISRLIADDGRIARVGAGRSARYGLRVEVAVGGAGDLGVELPLFRIDEAGLAHRVGLLERWWVAQAVGSHGTFGPLAHRAGGARAERG